MFDAAANPAESPVLVSVQGRVGRLTLNRPSAIHALTEEMCRIITDALAAWADDPDVDVVMLDHSGARGFCAGGDIRMIAESGAGDASEAKRFFLTEYRLNHLLFVYPKPVMAFLDGIVMGGGVGISDPARIRIATERTIYAMPETGIGLFPDVGGGWFLPRMPGNSGVWLALTGARLKAAECLSLGIATHYVESSKLEALKSEIVADSEAVFGATELFATYAGHARVEDNMAKIDRLFAFDTMEEIVEALQRDGSEWAMKELKALHTKSPFSMKVSLRQMRLGAQMTNFQDEMVMEYRMGGRMVRSHDFQEGVRAVIVDKDNAPTWSPADLAGVSDAMVEALFAPLPADEEWTPLPGL
ncbi:MAG TPA: enoyl-CoA hydratase/isomerase family protein [Caulobacteraceae bacterium]|jgi:enoyl-CoA hydratase|nr:enoyl-CoA hydratase/isomerase family protein [Caulobacteraceae bacterium]